MKPTSLIMALALSNFIYQAVSTRDWKVAAERSWFQAVAVLLAWHVGV